MTENDQRRFSVAVVSFHGDRAAVLLAPTRSVLMAKRVLEEAPVGGGTTARAGETAPAGANPRPHAAVGTCERCGARRSEPDS